MVKKSTSNYLKAYVGITFGVLIVGIIGLLCHNDCVSFFCIGGTWLSILSVYVWLYAANSYAFDLDDTSVPTDRAQTFDLAPFGRGEEEKIFLKYDAVEKSKVQSACSDKTYYANARNYEFHYIDETGREVERVILDELAATNAPRVRIETINASEKPRVAVRYGQYKSCKSRFWAERPARDYYIFYIPENSIGELKI